MANKFVTVQQSQSIAQGVLDKVNNKGYALATEVANDIDEAISSVFKPGRTLAANEIVASLLVEGNLGKVFNISEDFTSDSNFVEGADKNYPAGTNIVIVDADTTGENPTYKFDVQAGAYGVATHSGNGLMSSTDKSKLDGLDNYTEGEGIDFDDREINVKINASNAHGLSVDTNGIGLANVVADTHGFTQATGTYVAGTKYYSDSNGTTEVDTSEFEVGVTDVSSYYVASVTNGTSGAMTASDKYKLDQMAVASDSEIASLINGLTL